jgi:hypothetical protein
VTYTKRAATVRRFANGLAMLVLIGTHLGAVAGGETGVHAGHSALWHQPERDGEGWVLEMVEPDRAVLFWFTYDEAGNQRWLIGDGFVEDDDHGQYLHFPELRTTSGGRFGPDFDPDDVSYEVAGDAVMQFEGCDSGTFAYRAFGHEEEIPVTRLTQTMASACDESGLPVRSEAGLSGSWFDRDHTGEGFILHWLDRDEALMIWFTYTPGGDQAWMIGTGQPVGGAVVFNDVYQPVGGRFGPHLDPSEVSRPGWGNVVFELECTGGLVSYQSIVVGYGSGEQQLLRLSKLQGIDCPFPMTAHARLDQAYWDDGFSVAGIGGKTIFNPAILDFEPLDDDRLLAVGDFAWQGKERRELAMVLDSGDWQRLEGLPDFGVTESISAAASHPEHGLALAVQESLLIEGQAHGGRILVLGADGALQTIFLYQGLMRELEWFGDQLWLGGYFVASTAVPMSEATPLNPAIANLAIWNGLETLPAPGGSPNGPVYAIEREPNRLIIGGDFSRIGDESTGRTAAWDGQQWTALGLEGRVLSVVSQHGTLHAAGFHLSNPEDGVARHTGQGWEPVGTGFYLDNGPGVVSDVREFGGSLHAIGCFNHLNAPAANGGTPALGGIARWDGERWVSAESTPAIIGSTYWSSLACGFEPSPLVAWVLAMQQLVEHQDQLYVGGTFGAIDDVASHGLIAFDGEAFQAQGEAGLGTAGAVSSLAISGDGSTIYAHGPTHFGGQPVASQIARLDGDRWEPLEFSLPSPQGDYWLACGDPGQGLAIDSQGKLYMGCTWRSHDDPSEWAARLFRLGSDGWVEVPGVEGLPRLTTIIADAAGTIWIAGGDQMEAESGNGYIARVLNGEIEVFEDRFDGVVGNLSVVPGGGSFSLVAGGSFQSVDDVTARHVAHFDGDQWQALGAGASDVPSALFQDDSGIFMSVHSSYSEGGDTERLVLGHWNGHEWTELATEDRGFPVLADGTRAQFSHIARAGDRLFLAGIVLPADFDGQNLYIYEDGHFEQLAGGVSAFVDAMLLTHETLLIGGQIYQVDPNGEPRSSIGMARLLWK